MTAQSAPGRALRGDPGGGRRHAPRGRDMFCRSHAIARTRSRSARRRARSLRAIRRRAPAIDARLRRAAADVYWIRAIQHYGGDRLSEDRRDSDASSCCYPLLDLTTTLDPYFNIAYRFGAIFLAERPPGGPGRSDQAEQLLQKGIAAQPGEVAVLLRHRLRLLLARAGLQGRGRLVPAGCRAAERAELAAPAHRQHADDGQRSHRGALPLAADAAVGTGVAAPQRRAPVYCSSMRWISSTSSKPSSNGTRLHPGNR